MKVLKGDIGKWIRVRFDDVGLRDGILVDLNDKKDRLTFMEYMSTPQIVDKDQLVKVGPRMEGAPKF